jgi:RHS repeat-associated protein
MPGWMAVLGGLGKLLGRGVKKFRFRRNQNKACGQPGEPVNVVTGANVDDFLDYESTPAIPFAWKRYYSTLWSHREGPLGYGFRHQLQRSILVSEVEVILTNEEGEEIPFPGQPGEGEEIASSGYVLRRVSSSLLEIREEGRPTMEFELSAETPTAPLKRLRSEEHQIDLIYDEEGNLSDILCGEEKRISIRNDQQGRILELVFQGRRIERRLASYEYDTRGDLISWIDALGHKSAYEYDSSHRMTQKKDRRGYSYHYSYDQVGRCVHTYGEDGLYDIRFEYSPLENQTIGTFSDGGRWVYRYNDDGVVTEVEDPFGGKLERRVDERGRVVEEITSGGESTRLIYSGSDHYIGRIDSFGNFSEPLEKEPHPPDPLAHLMPETPAEWEHGGFLEHTVQSPERINLPAESLPERMKSRLTPNNPSSAEEQRDPLGRLLQEVDPELGVLKREYDEAGRLLAETHPDETLRRWDYDPNGNVLKYRDREGSEFSNEYHSWNLLRKETDPLGNATSYSYSATEEITRVTDPLGTRSEYSYDRKDRLRRVTRNGEVKEEYKYDLGDNLIEKVDSDGHTLMWYDIGENGLTSARHMASGENHYLEYDKTGHLTKASTDDSETLFEYDLWGRRVQDQRDGSGVLHSFDGAGKLQSTTVLGRFTMRFEHDSSGVVGVEDPAGGRHRMGTGSGRTVMREFENGSREYSQYDAKGRCVEKVRRKTGQQSEWSQSFEYSREGNLLRVDDSNSGEAVYEYDKGHRLVAARRSSRDQQRFTYDAAGNLISQPGLNKVRIDPGNFLLSTSKEHFYYDERHNLSCREAYDGTLHFEYDSFDQLTHCKGAHIDWVARYDPLGRRIEKRWGNRRVRFYWDTDRLAAEVDETGKTRIYLYPDATALVPFMFIDFDCVDSPPESGQQFYVFTNQIGAPVLVEDDESNVVWEADVEPYGRTTVGDRSLIDFNLRFPGHYEDPEIGLFCNRFRYYDPRLGRYIQSDPSGISGGLNLFAYSTRPLTEVDLRGLHKDNPGRGKKKGQKEHKPTKEELQNIEQTVPKAAKQAGMTEAAAMQAAKAANKHQVTIRVRPTNKHSVRWRQEGHPPKPAALKMKTVKEADVALNPKLKGKEGQVGFFDPTEKGTKPRPDDPALQKRYDQRKEEWADYQKDIKDNDVRVEDGIVIDNESGKAFAGDNDIFDIKDQDGNALPEGDKTRDKVLQDLGEPPYDNQHPDHVNWDPKDEKEAKIKKDIIDGHKEGGEPLTEFKPDGTTGQSHADD